MAVAELKRRFSVNTQTLMLLLLLSLQIASADAIESCDEASSSAANDPTRIEAPPHRAEAPAREETFLQSDDCLLRNGENGSGNESRYGREGIVWVDVRQGASIRRQPLRGVLEIALDELPTKTFLRDEHVVLLGSDASETRLLDACRQLRAQGWSRIQVLAGGVRHWPHDNAARDNSVLVEDYPSVAASPAWQVVTVGLEENELARLPVAPSLALRDDADIVRRLRIQQPANGEALLSTLLITKNQESSLQGTEAWRDELAHGHIFRIRGGWPALRHYLDTQTRIAASSGRALKRPCSAL